MRDRIRSSGDGKPFVWEMQSSSTVVTLILKKLVQEEFNSLTQISSVCSAKTVSFGISLKAT